VIWMEDDWDGEDQVRLQRELVTLERLLLGYTFSSSIFRPGN
jgi:hypothetical protein